MNDIILASIESANKYGACVVAVPAKDTIKRVSEGKVLETLPRDEIWQVQTPQTSRADWLITAHEKARKEGFYSTDEASLLEWAGYPVSVVTGRYSNIKITTTEDLVIAESLMKAQK